MHLTRWPVNMWVLPLIHLLSGGYIYQSNFSVFPFFSFWILCLMNIPYFPTSCCMTFYYCRNTWMYKDMCLLNLKLKPLLFCSQVMADVTLHFNILLSDSMKLFHLCSAQQIESQLPYLETSEPFDLFPVEAINLRVVFLYLVIEEFYCWIW